MELSAAEIARYLRMGREVPAGALAARVAALKAEALGVMCPRRVWRRIALPFYPASRHLSRHLAGCREAYLACGTLGAAFDRLQRRVAVVSGADAFIVQAIGAAAIEKWMDQVEGEIDRELAAGETRRARYSPGYGDFPLSAEREIVTLLDAPRQIGVSVTDTDLLVPSKTVTAVIGIVPQPA